MTFYGIKHGEYYWSHKYDDWFVTLGGHCLIPSREQAEAIVVHDYIAKSLPNREKMRIVRFELTEHEE